MISGLHHVAVLTADIDAAVAQYVALLGGQTPRQVLVDRPGVKLKSAMLPLGKTGATFLQIIQPIEGPGVEELRASKSCNAAAKAPCLRSGFRLRTSRTSTGRCARAVGARSIWPSGR
jgi:hypothetical protein